MTSKQDIRWKQRFQNYEKAFLQLEKFNKLELTNDLERQGFIKCFEYTYELSWNVMKDYLNYQGEVSITGSRDAIRLSFNKDLIEDGDSWMQMVADRILTVHTYDEETASNVIHRIKEIYFKLFHDFYIKFKSL